MRKDRRIWWRIVIGITLPLTVLVNYFVYRAFTRLTPGRLVQTPPHTLIVYEYEPLDSQAPPSPDELAKLFSQRLGADAVVAGHRRIRVRIPFVSVKAYEDRTAYLEALAELRAAGIDTEQFRAVMRPYAPPGGRPFMPPFPGRPPPDTLDDQLTELKDDHPGRADLIDDAADAHQAWASARGRMHDPAELKWMLLAQGRLEFRIAPARPDGARGLKLSEADLKKYMDQLEQNGPGPAGKTGGAYLWFPFHGSARTDSLSPDLIVAEHAGRKCILLCNQPDRVMLQTAGPAWALETAYATSDSVNRPAVGFLMDRHGAERMQALTKADTGSHMALLVDDEVYSAPVVRTTISDRGVIEGDFTASEVTRLYQLLAAGSRERLPVVPKLVSVQTVGYRDPPGAGTKRALLWAAAAAMALLVGGWLWAAIAGRVHAAGLLALALPAAAVGWWQIAAWDNLCARPFARGSIFANAIVAVPVLAVWIVAGATRRAAAGRH